ncbi:AraC family transcriptional regulator [Rhizobium sp. NXC24]|uniref:AraC family transcriptional regulator n=1 Tax=Rhizobium sp. NXC24 TaxID=2048897 RepID=UPI000CDF45FA|nr:AraC family transcriptional regulator [Rhizobium sp. NXC24]AVA26118.1 AraC family transcriptional regulator protein [Rhizobium sp. NXC24]
MTSLEEIHAIALRHAGRDEQKVPRLKIYSSDAPTELMAMIYEPVVCLVLQGAKRTLIGDETLEYGPGDCMIVAAEVVAMGQITEASPGKPYLAANLYLDPVLISSLLVDMARIPEPSVPSGFNVTKASPPLLEAWRRMVELLDRPLEIPVMASHFEHELLFRLLMGPQGRILRQIAGVDSRLSHIRRAMEWIREHYAKRLTIEAMADIAGMSVSVFHRRFKAVTGLSPLQYQKHVRLHEARRRILAANAKAASVAFAVGYESASQFSREYKRLFGEPPRRSATVIQSAMALNPV